MSIDNRPTWDEYFMRIASEVAQRSTCPRAQVGAVAVKDKRMLTTGYNGAPRGLSHCIEVGCLMVDNHCVRAIHAEQNALLQGALHGVALAGGTMYVTHQPCLTCAKMIINAGIVRVVFTKAYPDPIAEDFMRQANIELVRLVPPSGG
jgi:dCMP deaminase